MTVVVFCFFPGTCALNSSPLLNWTTKLSLKSDKFFFFFFFFRLRGSVVFTKLFVVSWLTRGRFELLINVTRLAHVTSMHVGVWVPEC